MTFLTDHPWTFFSAAMSPAFLVRLGDVLVRSARTRRCRPFGLIERSGQNQSESADAGHE